MSDPVSDVDFVVQCLVIAETVLRHGKEEIPEDEFSNIALEIDRLRAALFFRKYGIPSECQLAKNSGHQPSCDGNCIATRGLPDAIEAYQEANKDNAHIWV